MTQAIQFRIARRDDVGIESGVLDFAFPLVTEKLVARDERQCDQPQDYRGAPK